MEKMSEDLGALNQPHHADFFGRRAELEWFYYNLSLDPNDPARKTIVNVCGISGIGKSYLLDEIEVASDRLGFVTTRLSKDVTSPLEALYRMACQLSEKGCGFAKFINRYDQFLRRRGELAKLSELGIEEMVGETLGKVAGEVIKANTPPGATSPGDPAPVGRSLGELFSAERKNRQIKSQRDEDLNPLRAFSVLFLKDLEDVMADQAWICFIDGFDQTRDVLERWMAQLLGGEYGAWPANHLAVIASQKPLDRIIWAGQLGKAYWMALQSFNPQEVEAFLLRTGISDPQLIHSIIDRTGGLPLDVSNVASQQPRSADDLNELSDDQYGHFFDLFSDPRQKEIATHVALARRIDQDVLGVFLNPTEKSAEVFEWLRTKTSFLKKLSDGRGWEYHDRIRAAAIQAIHTQSRKTWSKLHLGLAEYYEELRASLDVVHEDGLKHPEYQAYTLEILYHSFCAQPVKNQALAVNTVVEALRVEGDFDLRCALTLQQAERECLIDESECWGNLLVMGLRASYEGKDLQRNVDMFDRILRYSRLAQQLRGLSYKWRGMSCHAVGRYEDAIADHTRAIELEPENAEYYDSRSVSYHAVGRYDEAIADCTRAIELQPENAEYYHSRGMSYHAAGRYEEAVTDKTRAIELEPGNAEYYDSRSVSYHSAGQYDKAITDCTRATELEPGNAEYYDSRGASSCAAGRYAEAAADCTRAIELEPENAEFHRSRGLSYHLAGLYEEANADYSRAIELEPDYPEYHYLRGLSNLKSGCYEDAITDFARAIELEPENAEYYHSRGLSYIKSGRYEEALADFALTIELEPENAEHHRLRGLSYLESGQYEEAITDFAHAIELEPENAKHHHLRGLGYHKSGRHEEAITECTHAIQLEPDNVWYYDLRGESALEAGQYEVSIADYTSAIRLEAEIDKFYLFRGVGFYKVGRFEEAIMDYTRAIELEPGSAWYYALRGTSRHAIGQFEESVADFTRAIELEPNNPSLYWSRSQAYELLGKSHLADADRARTQELKNEESSS